MGGKKMNSKKILLVDDDETLCDTLSKILTKRGHVVTSKKSGPEAIKSLCKSSYDILLTDLSMPEMDGVELLEAARTMAPKMVEIIITGHSDVTSYFDAMNAGAAAYIKKPVKIDELEAIFEKVLGKKRNRRLTPRLIDS